ncbi:MAG: hypothetical protein M0R40_11160 [Firmicutes bacterium]|nr:hypothetical protein [Bacillota bacterium]
MTETERYLYSYNYAIKEKTRLIKALEALRVQYTNYEAQYPCGLTALRNRATREVKRPTEQAAIYLVDHLSADIQKLNDSIRNETLKLSAIENLVDSAGLNGREREYVRLKYYEGKSREYIAMQWCKSVETVSLTRRSALEKIERKRLIIVK